MKLPAALVGALAFLYGLALCACSSHRGVAAAQPASVPSASTSIPNDVPMAGENGYTTPQCIYCPDSKYSDEALRAKIQGEIALDVVIATDGRAHNIRVIKGLGHGLDEEAIHAARDAWRFKPALGPDGKPAPVRMLVDIEFHLY